MELTKATLAAMLTAMTKAELDELMASKEWMCSVWVSNDLIKKSANQSTEPTAIKRPPSNPLPRLAAAHL